MAIDSENKGVGKVEPQEPETKETDVPEEEPEEGEEEPKGDGENPVEIDSSDKDPGSAAGGGSNFVTRAVGGLGNGLGKLSDAIGLPKGVTGSIIGVAAACIVGGAGIGLANSNYHNIMVRQEAYIADECASDVEDAKNAANLDADVIDADEQEHENAEKLWAWGKSMGMTDEQVAAMLGNFTQEGSMDPTSIEQWYIYAKGEQYTIGPVKASILGSDPMYDTVPSSSMDSYTLKIVSGDLSGYKINKDDVSGYCVGIGIMAWTGTNGYDLMATARTLNDQGVKDSEGNQIRWYNFEYQVAAISALTESWNNQFNNFLTGQDAKGGSYDINSVEECSMAWLSYMERGNDTYTDFNPKWHGTSNAHCETPAGVHKDDRFEWKEREDNSKSWYSEFQPQSASIEAEYSDFVDNVMSMIDQMGFEAANVYAEEEEDECAEEEEKNEYDNGDLARAAVAYAWENYPDSYHCDGTQLYKAIHYLVFNNMNDCQSCDNGVAAAVRWSGADDDYPQESTSNQYDYMRRAVQGESDDWVLLGEWGSTDCILPASVSSDTITNRSLTIDDLEPGDIFLVDGVHRPGHEHGHTFMYVTNEIVQEKYPSSPATCVEASLGDHSPLCTNNSTDGSHMGSIGGTDLSGRTGEHYLVYRYVGDYTGQYKDMYNGNDSGTS